MTAAVTHHAPSPDMFELPENEGPLALDDIAADGIDPLDDGDTSPSLPIILLSAASAIAGGIIVLYITYRLLALEIELSAGIATFFASITLGLTGAGLSMLSGSRAAMSNIAFSCGLIVISVLFLGICTLMGAITALLLSMLSG
ncbi:MAG: hypothetical protein KF832_11330 [Caldilineaceae bacterium]|nr:hypothetical protein [Caldilineaceae bacterium]